MNSKRIYPLLLIAQTFAAGTMLRFAVPLYRGLAGAPTEHEVNDTVFAWFCYNLELDRVANGLQRGERELPRDCGQRCGAATGAEMTRAPS